MRLIDADALMRMLWVLPNRMTRETALECFRNILNEAPTIEEEPVRHGEWKKFKDEIYCSLCECTALTGTYGGIIKSTYCPHCGAKMDGGKHDAAD